MRLQNICSDKVIHFIANNLATIKLNLDICCVIGGHFKLPLNCCNQIEECENWRQLYLLHGGILTYYINKF